MKAPISLDGVAVHPDCWCVCLNPEDGKMYLLVPAHPDCPAQSPDSCKMVVCVCAYHQNWHMYETTMTTTPYLGFTVNGSCFQLCLLLWTFRFVVALEPLFRCSNTSVIRFSLLFLAADMHGIVWCTLIICLRSTGIHQKNSCNVKAITITTR